jgi:hypothetical protein
MVAMATTVHQISSVAYEVPGRPFTMGRSVSALFRLGSKWISLPKGNGRVQWRLQCSLTIGLFDQFGRDYDLPINHPELGVVFLGDFKPNWHVRDATQIYRGPFKRHNTLWRAMSHSPKVGSLAPVTVIGSMRTGAVVPGLASSGGTAGGGL